MSADRRAGTAQGLSWRILQAADLAAMHGLHVHSIAGLSAQVVKPESRDFLQGLLRGRARVLGAWAGDRLVAYGVLQHDLADEDRQQVLLGLAPDAPLLKLAGAAVHPDWRGRGLQRHLVRQRLAWAGPVAAFATAAPGNLASWHNLLACGLAVRALQYRYGGHARYLLAHVPGSDTGWAADLRACRELGPEALECQRALLEQGWRGIAPGAAAASLRLAPAMAEASA